MNSRFVALIASVFAAFIAACGGTGAVRETLGEPERAASARILAETAIRVAVSKPGARVCRRIPIGISEQDLLRGVVTVVAGNTIEIRIDDAGRFPEAIAGKKITPGSVISDTPLNWTPCV